MTDPMLGDYVSLEQNLVQLDAQIQDIVDQLRQVIALDPDSENHRLQVLLGALGNLKAGDPVTLAGLLVVALARLVDCTGRHWVEIDESNEEAW